MPRFISAVSAVLLASFLAYSAAAAEKPLTESDVEAIVKKTLQDNPDLIVKSVEDYQVKSQASALSKTAQNINSLQDDFNKNPASPVLGNPKGDVTVVEFFDYHCGYCKHFFPTMTKLIDEDKNVRVVFKEFPILSADSELASKAALAVYGIDKKKYFTYHSSLMEFSGQFTREVLAEKAKDLGIPEDRFNAAMDSDAVEKELANNKKLARAAGITGTPAILIGSEMVPGAIGYDELKEKVVDARKAAKG